MECYRQSQVATREAPKPVSSGMKGIPPSFLPWRESEENTVSSVGQVSPIRFHHHLAELIRRPIGRVAHPGRLYGRLRSLLPFHGRSAFISFFLVSSRSLVVFRSLPFHIANDRHCGDDERRRLCSQPRVLVVDCSPVPNRVGL